MSEQSLTGEGGLAPDDSNCSGQHICTPVVMGPACFPSSNAVEPPLSAGRTFTASRSRFGHVEKTGEYPTSVALSLAVSAFQGIRRSTATSPPLETQEGMKRFPADGGSLLSAHNHRAISSPVVSVCSCCAVSPTFADDKRSQPSRRSTPEPRRECGSTVSHDASVDMLFWGHAQR